MSDLEREVTETMSVVKYIKYNILENIQSINYGTWAKAGLVFGTTVGTFALAKTTGALDWVSGLFSSDRVNNAGETGSLQTALTVQSAADKASLSIVPSIAVDDRFSKRKSDRAIADVLDVAVDSESLGLEAVEFEELSLSKVASTTHSMKLLSQGNPFVGGEEFQLNTLSSGVSLPAVTQLTNGQFVVVWKGTLPVGIEQSNSIIAQIFNIDGSKSGTEFKVNTDVGGDLYTSITALMDGKFIITWQNSINYNVYGQMYNLNSTVYGAEFTINTIIPYSYSIGYMSSTTLTNGKFVVVWLSPISEWWIHGRMFNIDGTVDNSNIYGGAEFTINTYSAQDMNPSVAALTNDSFVVIWQKGEDGNGFGVFGQMYNGDCSPYDPEFLVNTYTANDQSTPSVAGLTNGKFVVTWQSMGEDGDGWGIYGQMYNGDGSTYGSEFLVNTYTANDQINPKVVSLSGGQFIITWQSMGEDGDGWGVYSQIYNNDGSTYGPELLINTYTIGNQQTPVAVGLTSSEFFTAWSSDATGHAGIYGEIYSTTPTFKANMLIVNQGQSIVITPAMLNTVDLENNNIPVHLTYIITRLTHGKFTLVDAPDLAITSFTQQQVNDGKVQFIHDGGIVAPSYMVSVNDGTIITVPTAATITFDVAPVLVNNLLAINKAQTVVITPPITDNTQKQLAYNVIGSNPGSTHGEFTLVNPPSIQQQVNNGQIQVIQGQTVVITPTMLKTTDVDNTPAQLTYNITGTTHGQFTLVNYPNTAITSFTQQQVNDGQIQFIHDGGNAPSYMVSVSDGTITTTPIAATIKFNVPPVLVNNQLAINQGQTIVITPAMLNTTDPDNTPLQLNYFISGQTRCRFGLIDAPDIGIGRFTQQQVNDEQMQFIHDGSPVAPSYMVSVSDGTITTVPTAATITFDATPVLVNNKLTINQGQTVLITSTWSSTMLKTIDVDNPPAQLTYNITGSTHGQFTLVSAPSTAITTFTQQQINDEQIQFIHDGSSVAPSYMVSVSDGTITTGPTTPTIKFDATPTLVNNQLTVSQGQTIVITPEMLSTTDVDNTPEHLTYIITGLTHGKFILIDAPNAAITRFTQQQINDGQVQFIQDGGTVAPSYMVSVTDGTITTTPTAASISFTKISVSNSSISKAILFAHTNYVKENNVTKDNPKKIGVEQKKAEPMARLLKN